MTNSSSNEESNGEEPSETIATVPVATDDVTNSETVTNDEELELPYETYVVDKSEQI